MDTYMQMKAPVNGRKEADVKVKVDLNIGG